MPTRPERRAAQILQRVRAGHAPIDVARCTNPRATIVRVKDKLPLFPDLVLRGSVIRRVDVEGVETPVLAERPDLQDLSVGSTWTGGQAAT